MIMVMIKISWRGECGGCNERLDKKRRFKAEE